MSRSIAIRAQLYSKYSYIQYGYFPYVAHARLSLLAARVAGRGVGRPANILEGAYELRRHAHRWAKQGTCC